MRGLGGGGGNSLIDHGGLERERQSLRGNKRESHRRNLIQFVGLIFWVCVCLISVCF